MDTAINTADNEHNNTTGLTTASQPEDDGGLLQQAISFVREWQSCTEVLAARNGAIPRIEETPGPLVLGLCLSYMPVKATVEELQGASEDDVKAHKGIRVTFAVTKILSPGWSSVPAEEDAASSLSTKKGVGAGPKNAKNAQEPKLQVPKHRLGSMQGDTLHLHTNGNVNVRGVYVRAGRSEAFAAVSPGMILSLTVWGSKLCATFKSQKEDIMPFSFAVFQLGMRSLATKGPSTGMSLEIKTVTGLPLLSASAARLLRYDVFPHSIQEAVTAKERFLETPEPAAEGGGVYKDQSLIRGNLSSTVQLVSVTPTEADGVFAINSDGHLIFHFDKPVGDVSANSVKVVYDNTTFSAPSTPEGDEWVTRLFNVGMKLGAVQLFIVIDTYRAKDHMTEETVLDGFARVDVHTLIGKILAVKPSLVLPDTPLAAYVIPVSLSSSSPCTLSQVLTTLPDHNSLSDVQAVPNGSVKHLAFFASCGRELDIAIDVRTMSKKVGAIVEGGPEGEPTNTIVHGSSRWRKAKNAHFFFEKNPVFTAFIPLLENVGGGGAALARRALPPIQLTYSIPDVTFDDEEEEQPSSAAKASPAAKTQEEAEPQAPQPKQKKQKTAA